MEALQYLQKLYNPVQPALDNSKQHIIYSETPPANQLKPYIYCYWQLKTTEVLDCDFAYRVVSDGCIDIFINADLPRESFVMGFYSKFHSFTVGKVFNYIGIRFYPSIFPQLFQTSAKNLSNKVTPLRSINQKLARKLDKTTFSKLILGGFGVELDSILGQFFSDIDFTIDDRFNEALKIIMEKNGVLGTESDLKTGLSPRQLRRVFNHFIGTTPKSFSQVVRFQHILNAKPSQQNLRENKLFYNAGFYDQAHYIKEFKKFYGVTPAQAFR